MPTLLSRVEAREWLHMPLHSAARRYLDPQDEIGHMAAIMESLAATKELLFALAAGLYLIWERWRRLKKKEEQARFLVQKRHLDDLLEKTVRLEARQIGLSDQAQLRQMLDEITRIKLQALRELTDEQLRGDRSFLIFLTQCANLINKIQSKISNPVAVHQQLPAVTAAGILGGLAGWLIARKSPDHDGVRKTP